MYAAPRATPGGVFFEIGMTAHVIHRRRLLTWLAAGAALPLAGCGRKARPLAPPGADPLAPRRYPVDKDVPTQYRNVPPEFAPPPELPASPLQGPLYPVQPDSPSPFATPLDPIYRE
jgi:hypothetical protein